MDSVQGKRSFTRRKKHWIFPKLQGEESENVLYRNI